MIQLKSALSASESLYIVHGSSPRASSFDAYKDPLISLCSFNRLIVRFDASRK